MSFEAFFARIDSQDLRAVADHWRSARAACLMPAWRHIDPLALGPNLKIIWSWKYDRAANRFVGRLSGEEITRAFGKSMRGAKHEEFFPADERERVFRQHRRIVDEPAFALGTGKVFAHVGRVGVGERIILPLAEDGVTADGILGATVYRLVDGPSAGDGACAEYRLEYFPLA
jgi:hypothetical protein